MALILNKPQAEAVYTAMCAVNNVNGTVDVQFQTASVTNHGGRVLIMAYAGHEEDYDDQNQFASAYDLN